MKSKHGIFHLVRITFAGLGARVQTRCPRPRSAAVLFGLPLLYPVVYTLIYNTEVIRDLPVAVVDHSRTAESRALARMVDATSGLMVYDYCPDISSARRLSNEKKVFGVLEIPADYAKRLGRGEQAHVTYYSDMSLLLRYRTALSALTEVQLSLCDEIRSETVANLGIVTQTIDGSPIAADSVMTGDPTQGFASFIIPGIIVLILQQSMILGITMLAGASAERRRRNRGYDSMAIDAGAVTTIIGKSLCYLVCYIPMALYVLHIVPVMFFFASCGQHMAQLFVHTAAASCLIHARTVSWRVCHRTRKLHAGGGVYIYHIPVSQRTHMAALCDESVLETCRGYDSGNLGCRRIYPHQQQRCDNRRAAHALYDALGADYIVFCGTCILRHINFKGGRLKSEPSVSKN